MNHDEFLQIIKTIPNQPGVYKYYSAEEEIIYVGKAKNLRKRISSYFTKRLANYKTHELVKRIKRIEFTIVNSEQDAFFLENTLIKKHQPKYNINLKDDKSYPFIVIKNEPFPRVFLTRKRIHDGSEFLGPYTSVQRVRELLAIIRQLIPLRTCTLNLTKSNIEKKKFKVCLEYHLGNCNGPCEGLQSLKDYEHSIKLVKDLLKGNLGPVQASMKLHMKEYSENLEFEKAEQIRKKLEFLESYQSKSVVINPKLGSIDVFSFYSGDKKILFNYLMVQNGIVVQSRNFRVPEQVEEDFDEILAQSIAQARNIFNSEAKELIVSTRIHYPEIDLKITIPKAGDKKKLLELSEKNLYYFKEDILEKERLKLGSDKEMVDILLNLQRDLSLPGLPDHIECFDNSNFQGSYPVSAMICFRQGKPSKKDYRLFNIKTVKGINDFASMKEAVYRRYKRLNDEGKPWPNLVIIDGGKGQLHAAEEALSDLSSSDKTTLVGLAKREEELFFTGDKESVKLPLHSESLKLIRRIRDEVHRFGINFHRQKRSSGTFKNELEKIPGIGKATVELLLKELRSVKNIKLKSKEELSELIGSAKAKAISDYFHT